MLHIGVIKFMNEIMNRIQQLIFDRFNLTISYDSPILESGINSMNIMELIVDIEDEYNIEFDASALNYRLLRTIRSISEYVFEQINKE